MLHHQTPLSGVSVFTFLLLLTNCCEAHPQLIGPAQPIEAIVGDDVILSCHLTPPEDAAAMTLEWTRPDADSRFVFVWRSEQEFEKAKHWSYRGRTSLSVDELKNGNISLKLTNVKLSDKGTYKCYIPKMNKACNIEVVVASATVAPPAITLSGINRTTGALGVECRSSGWYPEPELSWLDAEGNLLSAGRPETVRGPDDLYTVSSRVTVEKRHDNTFTCRLTQNSINQTRETHIHVADDFFVVPSESPPITTGLVAGLAVCIMVIIALILLICCTWKTSPNKNKTNGTHQEETERGENKNYSKTEAIKVQYITQEGNGEREQLMTVVEAVDTGEGKNDKQAVNQQTSDKPEEKETKQQQTDIDRNEVLQADAQQTPKKLDANQAASSPSSIFNRLSASIKKHSPREQHNMEMETYEELKRKLEQKAYLLVQTKKEVTSLTAEVKQLKQEKEFMMNMVEMNNKQPENKQEAEKQLVETNKQLMEENRQLKEKNQQLQADLKDKKCEETKSTASQDQSAPNRTSSALQGSDTGPDIVTNIDPGGKHVRLRNQSKKTLEMLGWKLTVHVQNREPITYTFKDSLNIWPGTFVTLWAEGSGPPFNLVWKELKSWDRGNKVDVTVSPPTAQT